jgi:hypothetical protein
MQVFISYAAEDREVAEQIHLALTEDGHQTFFDRSELRPGEGYHGKIQNAVNQSDVFVFLASPASTKQGAYSLSELACAKKKWRHPSGHVIPVRLRDVSMDVIPVYLKAVTVLEPPGVPAADVLRVVNELRNDGSGKLNSWPIAFRAGLDLAVVINNQVVPGASANPLAKKEAEDCFCTFITLIAELVPSTAYLFQISSAPQIYPIVKQLLQKTDSTLAALFVLGCASFFIPALRAGELRCLTRNADGDAKSYAKQTEVILHELREISRFLPKAILRQMENRVEEILRSTDIARINRHRCELAEDVLNMLTKSG